MKRHRVLCEVWKSRRRGTVQIARTTDTLQRKYGVEVRYTCQVEGSTEKRKATNLDRYGAESPFSKESSTFAKVQSSLEGKRPILKGSDNPFAWPEVQEKIRQVHLGKRGVENPQQDPEVRARMQETNLDRWGAKEILASPAIRKKILATNQYKYGGNSPACSPEVVEKARQTNLERWGVEWTGQHPDIRARQVQTQLEIYGSHFFASEEGRAAVKAALQERYGVDHPSKIEGFWEKTVATFVRKYGANHPLLLAEFLDKRRATCQARFGVGSPLQNPEVYAKLVATNQERYESNTFFGSNTQKEANTLKYGVPHPMMNREYALAQLEKMKKPGPNIPEKLLGVLAPTLTYTGDGSFWRWLPLLDQHKNPDFIVPGPDPEHPKKGVTKVVELFGDFWHSRMFTGKANFEHESELVAAFAGVGIQCLVVWESEVKKKPTEVQMRVASFIGR